MKKEHTQNELARSDFYVELARLNADKLGVFDIKTSEYDKKHLNEEEQATELQRRLGIALYFFRHPNGEYIHERVYDSKGFISCKTLVLPEGAQSLTDSMGCSSRETWDGVLYDATEGGRFYAKD